jgi:hypothetical protein
LILKIIFYLVTILKWWRVEGGSRFKLDWAKKGCLIVFLLNNGGGWRVEVDLNLIGLKRGV